ncbi:MAG: DUF624 domain-containing protein [Solobacterium sp.]|nr:DUF624 domain-containing protein [Solobacterium sp.]
MHFFSYDSKFSQILLKISCSCWLNVLWFACSLPVVTLGASTTALYDVSLRIVKDRETHITKEFFTAFRKNFRQATKLWLIMLGAGIFLVFDLLVVSRLRSASSGTPAVLWTLILAVLIAAMIVYAIILTYIFPLIAYFENNDWAMLKNAFLIGTRYLFSTILVFAIHFAMFWLIVAVFTPLAIFGEGMCAMLSSFIFAAVFRACAYTSEEEN